MAEKSRVEVLREQKKKIAEQIKQALAAESTKKRKREDFVGGDVSGVDC